MTQNNKNSTTTYAGNFIYEDGALQLFFQPEGYVQPDGNGSFEYVYQYKDHLGNIRLSYYDMNNNEKIDPNTEILDENNYYPFGLEHKGYNENVISAENNYKTYQSKELEKELGLNWHDFGARRYMADIGRWISPDPLSSEFPSWSPYTAMNDDPINFVDPTGMAPEDWYWNLETGNYEYFEGSGYREGYKNIGSHTNLTIATKSGGTTFKLNKNGSFSNLETGEFFYKGESTTAKGGTKITSHLNLKETGLKMISDMAASFFELPQKLGAAVINQFNVAINEGIHEGGANNYENIVIHKTYELNNWRIEPSNFSPTSTETPSLEEGQETINNTISIISTPYKAVNNPVINTVLKSSFKKIIKEVLQSTSE